MSEQIGIVTILGILLSLAAISFAVISGVRSFRALPPGRTKESRSIAALHAETEQLIVILERMLVEDNLSTETRKRLEADLLELKRLRNRTVHHVTYENPEGEVGEFALDPSSEESIREFLNAMRETPREQPAGAR